MKKIAIMTAGGDCSGLNAAIKTVVMSCLQKGVEVVGIVDGYRGFIEGYYRNLGENDVFEIETKGGTILGSSNKECPFYYLVNKETKDYEDLTDKGIKQLKDIAVEGLIIIGGDGTLDSARVIYERGMPTVGVAKTIDNDMEASNPTIGFDTAISNVVDAISKVKSTGYSHRRVIIVEIMGRTSGYLALYSGFASSADIILLPEQDYNLDLVCEKVKEITDKRRYAIIAISESSKEAGKQEVIAKIIEDSFEQKRFGGVSEKLAEEIEAKTGIETRNVILGHIQRGGAPTPNDIINASLQGGEALRLLLNNEPGYIVGMDGVKLTKIEFPKIRVARTIDFKNNELIRTAKEMGICFGDKL